jgi:hypothetical protein
VVEGLIYVGLAILIRSGHRWALYVATLLYACNVWLWISMLGFELNIPTALRIGIATALLIASVGSMGRRH